LTDIVAPQWVVKRKKTRQFGLQIYKTTFGVPSQGWSFFTKLRGGQGTDERNQIIACAGFILAVSSIF
jgi:hypothetical protein